MKNLLRLARQKSLNFAALFIASGVLVHAVPVGSPEPADYALGFGAATLGFIVWRNFRRARGPKRRS